MLQLCHVTMIVTSKQMWITVCDEPKIYSNKNIKALTVAPNAIQ
jgi:hypothetical protein